MTAETVTSRRLGRRLAGHLVASVDTLALEAADQDPLSSCPVLVAAVAATAVGSETWPVVEAAAVAAAGTFVETVAAAVEIFAAAVEDQIGPVLVLLVVDEYSWPSFAAAAAVGTIAAAVED